MKSFREIVSALMFVIIILNVNGYCQEESNKVYTGITVAPSYMYYMTGRTDRITGFVINVDDDNISNPAVIFLASGIEAKGDAYFILNNKRYAYIAQKN